MEALNFTTFIADVFGLNTNILYSDICRIYLKYNYKYTKELLYQYSESFYVNFTFAKFSLPIKIYKSIIQNKVTL